MIKFNNGSYIKLSIHLLLKDLSITCYEAQVLNTHLLSKEELLSVMLWCSVYLYYKALLNKARTQVLRHFRFVQIFDKDLKRLI